MFTGTCCISCSRELGRLRAHYDSASRNEFNIANDPRAVQAILDSGVPLVIGPGDVCRASLSLSLDQAKEMIAARGPIGAWLWEEFQARV
jgi:inosine-uridine nucleoside N-ribohydrolase